MKEIDCPIIKVTISRYLLSFIISYASLFILLYIILVLFHRNQDFFAILMVIFLLLAIPVIIRLNDYYCEFSASREDWKNPHVKTSSCGNNSKKSTWLHRSFSQIKIG
jgi:Ca2+/Na+ antiporter